MFLNTKLQSREKPIKVAFIGCGKFVSMFLAQYNQLQKITIDTIVDINIDNAKKNCLKSGLTTETVNKINFVTTLDEAIDRDVEVFIEATGNPIIGTVHAVKIIKNKKHIILVNVEADVTCGKYLADLAKENNVICSMAYGDQPSLIINRVSLSFSLFSTLITLYLPRRKIYYVSKNYYSIKSNADIRVSKL